MNLVHAAAGKNIKNAVVKIRAFPSISRGKVSIRAGITYCNNSPYYYFHFNTPPYYYFNY